MNNEQDLYLIDKLGPLASAAMAYAKQAHASVLKDRDIGAIAFLSLASSKISAFQAIYLSHYEILERSDIDNFLHQFEVFQEELASNYAKDHSHQWTDIEFERLVEFYESSVLL
jgi:hypothetical protein